MLNYFYKKSYEFSEFRSIFIHNNMHFLRLFVILVSLQLGSGQLFGQFNLPGLPQNPSQKNRPHAQATLVSQFDQVSPGQSFFLAVLIDIDPGWHLYANPIGANTDLIPTQVQAAPADGIEFGQPIYPTGTPYADQFVNVTVNVYKEHMKIFVPVKVTATSDVKIPVELQLSGVLCEKSCIRWDDLVQTSIDVSTAGAGQENQPEIFASLDIPIISKKPETQNTSTITIPTIDVSDIEIPEYVAMDFKDAGITSDDWVKPLLLALLAGAILNLMPCVLPVVPLKVLQLIQQAQKDAASDDKYKAVKLSIVFSLGIVVVFAALAVVMSSFKLIYGQQFQSLTFKFVMLMIVYLLTLSMFGIFEVMLPSKLNNIQIVREGYLGAFGMGVLATLLATPCSAPLLGPVLAWSLSKTMGITVMVFLVIGLGMAVPYVLLTAFPKLMNKIPKAGSWMIRLKQGLGFVMLGVSGFLIFLFPGEWQFPLVIFCVCLALGLWLAMQVVNAASPPNKRLAGRLCGLLVVVLGGWFVYSSVDTQITHSGNNFELAKLVELNQQGEHVMVEFTASWCLNCKVVEKTVLDRDEFKSELDRKNVTLMIADISNNTYESAVINKLLKQLGSESIPFTAIFPGDNPMEPIVLRDIYTLDTILEALSTL